MKRIILSIITVCILVIASPGFANMPAIYHIVLDASGSVSEADFRQAKSTTVEFAEALFLKSQMDVNLGRRADWLSVSYFGGKNDYTGGAFINCSNKSEIEGLKGDLETIKHPQHNKTAIYNAIKKAVFDVFVHNLDLPGEYIRNIILVTDGKENGSDKELREHFSDHVYFTETSLFVIGVGKDAKVDEFKDIANIVLNIDEYEDLAAILMAIAQIMPE